MKRAKKGLAFLVSLCMIAGMLPAFAYANGDTFAEMKVGDKEAKQYDDQSQFFSEFQQATGEISIKLLDDVTINGYIPVSETQNVELDLNGCTLSTGVSSGSDLNTRHHYAIENNGTLLIEDTAGNGSIKARGVKNLGEGIMVINGGTFIDVDANGGAAIWNEADLTINGGTFKTEHVGSASDQFGPGCLNNGGKALITGGTFEGASKRTYAIISTGELEITPGSEKDVQVKGAHGALSVDSGTAVINGGSYSSTDFYGLYVSNDGLGQDPMQATVTVNDGTFDGKSYAVWVGSDYNDPVNSTIQINGGHYLKPLNAQEVAREGAIVISGGTFASDVSEYLAPSSSMIKENGNWVVAPVTVENGVAEVGGKYYASLQKAVDNAGKGETVTLLQNTAEDIVIPEGAELTLNLNGKTLTNHEDHTITNKGTLTITGDGTVDNVTHARAAIQNEPGGNVVLNGGAYTRSKENGQNAEASGGNSYYNIVNHGTMEINSGVSVTQKGQFSSMIENGWYNGSQNTGKENSVLTINGGTFSGGLNTIKNGDYGELVINDGTFTSMSQAAFLNWNVATVNGGTFDAAGASNGVILNGYIDGTMDQGELTINGGTFNAGEKTVITTMGGGTHSGDIEITGGTLNGSIVLTDSSEGARLTITQKAKVTGNVTNSGKADVAITDGATVDGQVSNSAGGTMSVVNSTIGSVPEGTTAETIVIVNSTVDGTLTTNTAENAAVMVGGKTYETLGAAITAAKAGDTIYVLKDIPEAAGIAVLSGKNFTIDFGGHTYTLKDPGAGSAGTESNGFQFLMNSTITLKNGTVRIAEGTTSIKRIIQNYANLTLEDMHFFAEHQADGEDYALSFNNGSIIFKGDMDIVTTSDEAIAFDVCKYSSYPSANVAFDESYTGTINGKIVYDSTDADTHKLTIQGNGTFGAIEAASGAAEAAKSGIEVTSGHFAKPVNEDYLADSVKAQLESASNPEAPYSYYPSLEAAQAAAQPGDTITEVNAATGGTKYTVTLDYADGETANSLYTVTEGTKLTLPTPSRSGYTFEGWYDGSSRVSSPYKVMKDVTLTAEWDYNGSSSSSGSTRYTVSVEDTDNGSVEVSPTRASKGSTVTVTVKPDEGYELDELTVTDKNGDSVKLTDKGDGKYTFQMPASKVTVEAVFTAVEPEPEGLPFTDVTSGDWFYDAVAYVYDKGMMEGTTDTTFAPTMNLTRSMIAQVLYNLEERPEAPGAAGFPDVAADAWYADAVNWAAARGIVKGYDTGAFGPEDSVTREQLAAILYRYAQAKGYDTTRGGMAVREFSDSASISDWAQEAMAWAVNAQVLSGKGNGVLDPQGTATRAEVAQMLMNFGEHVG